MLLSETKKNNIIEIKKINIDEKYCLRLREMGINPGSKLCVTNKGAFGAYILGKGYEKIAVDSKCAKCIEVEIIDAQSVVKI